MNVLSRICKDYILSAMTLINTVNVSHKMAQFVESQDTMENIHRLAYRCSKVESESRYVRESNK